MLLLCGTALVVSARMGGLEGGHLGGSLAAVGIVGALYALGWRARDRAAGLAAGLLAATSAPFLHLAAWSPESAPFALLTVAALFAFVAGSSLAALALAAGATQIRADGFLLGLLLLGLSLAQHRKRAIYGGAVFLLPILAVWSGRIAQGGGPPLLPAFGLHSGVWHWLWLPSSVLLLWLLLPFCAEMSEPQRRARWLPVVLWTLLSLLSASLESITTPTGMLLPLMPLLFALAGGGLSRLLPTLAGEFPSPAGRYALAALAVLGLVVLHARI